MAEYIKIDDDTFGLIADPNPTEIVKLSDLSQRIDYLDQKINMPTDEELREAYVAQNSLSFLQEELNTLQELKASLEAIE